MQLNITGVEDLGGGVARVRATPPPALATLPAACAGEWTVRIRVTGPYAGAAGFERKIGAAASALLPGANGGASAGLLLRDLNGAYAIAVGQVTNRAGVRASYPWSTSVAVDVRLTAAPTSFPTPSPTPMVYGAALYRFDRGESGGAAGGGGGGSAWRINEHHQAGEEEMIVKTRSPAFAGVGGVATELLGSFSPVDVAGGHRHGKAVPLATY